MKILICMIVHEGKRIFTRNLLIYARKGVGVLPNQKRWLEFAFDERVGFRGDVEDKRLSLKEKRRNPSETASPRTNRRPG